MKTNRILFVYVFLFVFGVSFADQEKTEPSIPSLPALINLEKKTVEKYKAYEFNVNWIDEKPYTMNIFREIDDLQAGKVKTKLIVLVEPKSTSLISEGINSFNNALAGLAISKVVGSLSNKNSDIENGASLIRFDSYDSKGVIRSSEWRDSENGTQVEHIVFSNAGKPLTMTFYYKLKINQNFKPIMNGGKFLTLSLDQVVNKLGLFDYSNPDEVIDMCIKLLRYAEKLQGKDLDENY